MGKPQEEETLEALQSASNDEPAGPFSIQADKEQQTRVAKFAELSPDEQTALLKGDKPRQNQAARIIEHAKANCTLVHDDDGLAYAKVDVGTHTEAYPLAGQLFEDWLGRSLYEAKVMAGHQAKKEAIGVLRSVALYEGEKVVTARRVKRVENTVYIDLANDKGDVLEVTGSGWRLTDNCPVVFIRGDCTRQLPRPLDGGDIGELWRFCNVAERHRLLVLAWMVEAFNTASVYPVLSLSGLQGSAKSTTQRFIRQLIDPNKADLRGAIGKAEDMYTSAAVNHVLSYENLSRLTGTIQDTMCAISTGAGFGSRKYYGQGEEMVLEAKNPIMLNGIGDLVTRQDLIDRTLAVECPKLCTGGKVLGSTLTANYMSRRPYLFGALLDLIAASLLGHDRVSLTDAQQFRMGEFAITGQVVALHLGKQPQDFIQAFQAMRDDAQEQALEGEVVAQVLRRMMAELPVGGTMRYPNHELLKVIRQKKDEGDGGELPTNASTLGKKISRLSDALETCHGVKAEPYRTRDQRGWVFTKVE